MNLETFHHRDHARAIVKLFARKYNQDRPHSSLGTKQNWAITPSEFYENWKKQNAMKDGFAGGGGSGLSLGSPPAVGGKKDGPTEMIDRPDSRMAVHVGAPVAPQQSRILRVDQESVTESASAGTSPVNNPPPSPKT